VLTRAFGRLFTAVTFSWGRICQHKDCMNGVFCNHKNDGKTAVYKRCTQEMSSREFFLKCFI